MPLQISEFHMTYATSRPAVYCMTGAVATITFMLLLKRPKSPLDKIPSVGSNSFLGSWWDGVKFLSRASDVVQEGYAKYKGTPFKVPSLFGWIVIVSGRRMIEEFCKFRDDELNLTEAINEVLKLDHTFETESDGHPYHISTLRQKMNRNLAALFADMQDEVVAAFDEQLNLKGHEWKSVPLFTLTQQVVSRTSNRVLVGLPMCRVPDWVQLNIEFTMDIFKMAAAIAVFPKFMSPLVKLCMTSVSRNSRRGERHMTPIIEARRKQLEEYGSSWADKPNDFLTWLLEGSQGSKRSANDLTQDILGINFAAIHTTSQAFAFALYNLAANPQYIEVLREEVESVVKEEGWSKTSVFKMYKVDSFMKESKRLDGSGFTSVLRKAVKDISFADGTVIPKGTFVALATQSIHTDDESFDGAMTFDPLRFAKMRTGQDDDALKYQFTATNYEYLPFGHGRNACPGRFFAATVLNTMLAHVVASYDVKLEHGGVPGIGATQALKPTTRVMVRKRMT